MSEIIILGAKGQLGQDCVDVFSRESTITPLDIDEVDVSEEEQCTAMLSKLSPQVVINCSAYTQVDRCETDMATAWAVNAKAPGYMAEWCTQNDAYLVHVSTDYVFDGEKEVPAAYTESDPVNPVSEYGKSKLAGERAIQEAGAEHSIVRTAWLYGVHGVNFLKTMLRLAVMNPEKELKVVHDQFGCPTWSATLAQQLQEIVQRKLQGVYHATGEGYCSWYELAQTFLTQMDVPHRLTPCSTKEYPTPARRPGNSILENQALKEQGCCCMKPWEDDLNNYIESFKNTLIKEITG